MFVILLDYQVELEQIDARDQAAWRECARRFELARTHTQDVLPGLPNCMNLRGELNLVYTSDAIQPRRDQFDSSYHFVGPCYDDRPADRDAELEAAIESVPRPLIYVSLGSMRMYNEKEFPVKKICEIMGISKQTLYNYVKADHSTRL